MRRSFHVIALFLFLCLPLCAAEEFSGKVVRITDGDDVEVLRNGKPEDVRLYGIDCPEKAQAFGTRAKQFTGDLSSGKIVTVKVRDKDLYGRTVGEVILPDGTSLSQEIVRAGFAWWYQRYAPDDETLKQLEGQARREKKGLWGDPNPVPPWEFRRTQKSSKEGREGDEAQSTESVSETSATALMEQVQQCRRENEKLKKRVERMERENEELKRRVERLEQANKELEQINKEQEGRFQNLERSLEGRK